MSQNPLTRRAYLIRPNQELKAHFLEIEQQDLIDSLLIPTVVMTEALPFEGKLEGYRALIQTKCKEAYLTDLFALESFENLSERQTLPGDQTSLIETFDKWWILEEVDTLEIATTW